MNEEQELPQGWIWTVLNDVSFKISDGSHNPPKGKESGIPMLSAKNIFDHQIEFDEARLISEEDYLSEISRINILAGDVLLTIVGTIGRTAVVSEGLPRFSLQRSVAIIKPKIDSRFLSYCLSGPAIQQELLDRAKGTAQKGVYLNSLKLLRIPLPPLPEQRRIVAKLEELFSKLDAGVAAVRRTQALLKRYRQSVLHAAVTGELTRAWREQQVGQGTHASQLTWKKTTIGEVTYNLDNRRKPVSKKIRQESDGQYPYYGANGQTGWINDFLFNEDLVLVVEDETFVGRVKPFCYKISGKTWVNNHAHVLKAKSILSTDYLNYSLAYYPFTPLTTGSTGRKKLTKAALTSAPYELPSLDEQHKIVAEVERALSVIDTLEATLADELRRAERLRQSILHRAFTGRLVPQDATDEPAAALLARLRATPAAPAKAKAGRGRKASAQQATLGL